MDDSSLWMLEILTFLCDGPFQREKNYYFLLVQQVPSHFLEAWKDRGCALRFSLNSSSNSLRPLNGPVWSSGFSLPVLTGSALLTVWWGNSHALKGPIGQLLPGKPRNLKLQWTCFFFSFLPFSFTHNSPFLACLLMPNTKHKYLNTEVFHQLWLDQELASLPPYTFKRPFSGCSSPSSLHLSVCVTVPGAVLLRYNLLLIQNPLFCKDCVASQSLTCNPVIATSFDILMKKIGVSWLVLNYLKFFFIVPLFMISWTFTDCT